MKKVLVTGSNGFVGSAVCRHFAESGLEVNAAIRTNPVSPSASGIAQGNTFVVGSINQTTEWQASLTDVDVVIHAAARVHVMRERSDDPLAEFRRVNTAGTEHLAREAAKLGVKRFVYVSSIKVNGEHTQPNTAFREIDEPCPQDPYGISKLEAELALKQVSAETGLEVVIVRPPLVYGPNVKGNIASMLSLAYRGLPLPLAAISNARSFIALDNLCSFLGKCAVHPKASGETFLVSDRQPLSTPDLFRFLSAGMGKKAKLYSVSEKFLKIACTSCGLSNVYRRLCQSLVVDSTKATKQLGWEAPAESEQALAVTGRWYLNFRQQFVAER